MPLAAIGAPLNAMRRSLSSLFTESFGVGILRKSWINLDWLWTGALIGAGMLLLVQAK